MTTEVKDGWSDLEKELSCSICTDLLYQPLTLLNCLHTFCGSCLKEWFSWQADAAVQGRAQITSDNPYTCPQCRDSIRGTKADWRVTSLLEGYLRSHPDREKPEAEKQEMRKVYKPGDDVIPPVAAPINQADSDDERLMANIRELSMRDMHNDQAQQGATRHRTDGSRDHRRAPARRDATQTAASIPADSPNTSRNGGAQPVARQGSLRHLLNASPIYTGDIQQEILQSIYEEGLLNGVDIDNLTPEQEEEFTERIAEAYRRRHRRRDRSRNHERQQAASRSPQPPLVAVEAAPTSEEQRPSSASDQPSSRLRPPISRPHLFEDRSRSETRARPRTSSSSRQVTYPSSRLDVNPAIASASRSATDVTTRPQAEDADRQRRRRRVSTETRSHTEPQLANSRGTPSRTRTSPDPRSTPVVASGETERSPPQRSPPVILTVETTAAATTSALTAVSRDNTAAFRESDTTVRPVASVGALAPEPLFSLDHVSSQDVSTIACQYCKRSNIRYELHYHCSTCRNGHFDICLTCYRDGQGCDHWFGFGYTAYERYRRLEPQEGWSASYEQPHILSPRRFHRQPLLESTTETEDDKLEEGAFCEICFVYCDDYYWSCAYCLDGAWGFCKTCVHQGKHCTHPLLPVSNTSKLSSTSQPLATKSSPLICLPHLSQTPGYIFVADLTDCDICHRSILPTATRFHCYQCSDGNYDICTECYYSLVATGKIKQKDGPTAWRRCLRNHRMVIIGYQEVPGRGQQRVTVRDPVGGWRWKDLDSSSSSSTSTFSSASSALSTPISHQSKNQDSSPPADGTLGMRCLAIWSRFPPADVKDELSFPKNAEIREVETKNVDWSLGVYAGSIGLFPSNHVRTL